jgi:hypothetical protein
MILTPKHARPEGFRENEEFLKGEISGANLFMKTPEILVEMSKIELAQQENSDDNASSSD